MTDPVGQLPGRMTDPAGQPPPHHYPGLTEAEAAESRRLHGANVLTPPERDPWWKMYLEKFEDPIIRILMVAAGIAIGIGVIEIFTHNKGSFTEGIGIIIAILLATTLAFINEYKAGKEFDILNQAADGEPVRVIRDGRHTTVPKRDLVVGDVLALEQGEEIPADAEVLTAVSFMVNEASLTGESHPVRKRAEAADSASAAPAGERGQPLAYPAHQLLRGTFVADGHALARVTAVGDASEIGRAARASSEETDIETPLNRQLAQLSKVVGVFGFGIAVLLFAVLTVLGALANEGHWANLEWRHWYFFGAVMLGLAAIMSRIWLPVVFDALELLGREQDPPAWLERKGFMPWLQAGGLGLLAFGAALGLGLLTGWISPAPSEWFLGPVGSDLLKYFMVAVALIVMAVPEGLPMSVTLSLAYSMRKMTASNNLVRRMHACETIGAATVICSDKTGTLTRNEMTLHGLEPYPRAADQADGNALWAEAISVNSTAEITTDGEGRLLVPLGNPTEAALLLGLAERQVDYQAERDRFPVAGQLTFSTELKYMSTLGHGRLPGGPTLHVKGAPEIILARCAGWRDADGTERPWTGAERDALLSKLRESQTRAYRTLGFAYRVLPESITGGAAEVDADRLREWSEDGALIWMGFAKVADPVRADVPAAVAACGMAGVKVKIVTGDNPATAREVARQIGLWREEDAAERGLEIGGDDFMAMDEAAAAEAVGRVAIISRARPLAKQRLVNLLQKRGEVVAVTGDGTNDAPALNHADVGLAMGVTGTSVAKEAADIILLDDSFSSIARAVMWGRSLYANIQKFITFQLTTNVTALGMALVGPFLGITLPITVVQMLWVNLIMDTFAALALATEPPDAAVMRRAPRRADAFIITPGMSRYIFGMGAIFLLIFIVILKGFHDTFPIDDTTPEGLRNLTIFFTGFVFMHFWNLFNIRMLGRDDSAFKGLGGSPLFLLVAGAIAVGQWILTQFGGEMFRTTGLSAMEWLVVAGATSITLWIGEIVRWTRRMRRPA